MRMRTREGLLLYDLWRVGELDQGPTSGNQKIKKNDEDFEEKLSVFYLISHESNILQK